MCWSFIIYRICLEFYIKSELGSVLDLDKSTCWHLDSKGEVKVTEIVVQMIFLIINSIDISQNLPNLILHQNSKRSKNLRQHTPCTTPAIYLYSLKVTIHYLYVLFNLSNLLQAQTLVRSLAHYHQVLSFVAY